MHVHGKLAHELKMTTDQVGGQNPVQFFGSDIVRQHMLQAWSGQPASFTFRHKRRQLGCHLEPVLRQGESGEVSEVVGYIQDVTEQRKIERKLSLFAHTLSSLNEAVSVTDSEDVILYVNPAFCKLYGYAEEEVLNKTSNILWSDRNPKSVTEPILRDTLGGGWRGLLYNRNKAGEHFMINLHTSAVRDEHGEVIGCVGVAERVSDANAVPGKLGEELPALQAKALGGDSVRQEYNLVVPVETLRERFREAFVLHKKSEANDSAMLWFSEKMNCVLLALIEAQEPDEISSYRSLMVSGLLDQIFSYGLVSLPDQVLDKMHRLFAPFLALNYNVSGSDPKINVGLCNIALQGGTFRYAGANLSLFYQSGDRVRWVIGEDEPLKRSEGDPQSRYFKLFTQQISSGDSFYLVSQSLFSTRYKAEAALNPEVLKNWLFDLRSLPLEEQQLELERRVSEILADEHEEAAYLIAGLRF